MFFVTRPAFFLLGPFLSMIALANSAIGQTYTWNGNAGVPSWMNPGNWSASPGLPVSGQNTRIEINPSNQVMDNDFVGFQLNALRFLSGGHTLTGNSLTFVSDSLGNTPLVRAEANTSVSTDWVLNNHLALQNGSPTFVYSGTISGAGDLNISFGTGMTLASSGAINNSGAINILGGTNTFNGTVGNGGLMSVSSNATIAGTGTINRNIAMPGAANFSSSGNLTVNGNVSITNSPNNLLAGTLTVNGDVTVDSGLLQTFAGSTLSGTGQLRLENGGDATVDGQIGSGRNIGLFGILFPVFLQGSGQIDGSITINGNHSLRGNLTLNNNTLIQSTTSLGAAIGDGGTITNNGQIRITPTATATLSGNTIGSGTVQVDSGATLNLQAFNIGNSINVNGTAALGGSPTLTSQFRLDGGVLKTNSFTLNVSSSGEFRTSGTSEIQGSGINVIGNSVIESGSLTLTTGANWAGAGGLTVESGATLINNSVVNKTVLARGSLNGGVFNGPVTGENAILIGILRVNDSLTVQTPGITQLQPSGNLTVTGLTTVRQGTLKINSSAIMEAEGNINVIEDGILRVDGTLNTDNLAMNSTTLLQGVGLISGNMSLDGIIGPGNSAGTLKVNGTLTASTTATVCIEIGGIGEGNFDILDGRGSSSIALNAPRLDLSLIGGFVPSSSDEFVFLKDFSTITGSFGNGDGDGDPRISFASGSFAITYGTNSVRLYDFQPVPEPSGLLTCYAIVVLSVLKRRRSHGETVCRRSTR